MNLPSVATSVVNDTQRHNLQAREYASIQVGETRQNPATIYYKTYGTGPHKVVFLSGLMGRGDQWQEQVESLQKNEYQVLVLDNRGVGESSISIERYTTHMMAEDVYEVLKHLGWDMYHVVGQSMGGMIAQELALLDLSRIASLALVATHAGSMRSIPPSYCMYMMTKNLFVSDLEQNIRNAMQILFGRTTLDDRTRYDEMHSAIVENKRQYGGNSFRAFMNQVCAVFTHRVTPDRLGLIEKAAIPTVVIAGTQDQMVCPSNAHELAMHLKVEPILLENVGHHVAREYSAGLKTILSQHFQASRKD